MLILSLRTVVLEDVDIYKNCKILPRQPRITVIIMGKFLLDKIVHSIRATESKGSQINQTGIHILIGMKASKRLKESKIASLKNQLQKAKEKLRAQKVPKTKTIELT